MDDPRIAEIIGRRELSYTTAEGRTSAVSVSIRRPVPRDRAFFCRYEIHGLGSKLDRTDDSPFSTEAGGVDELQALTVALNAIWLNLRPHTRHLSLFGARGHHGFPFVLPIGEIVRDLDVRESILASIDTQVDAYLEAAAGATKPS